MNARELALREGGLSVFRVDPARNMARFYRLLIQPSLFGGVDLVREWGRIPAGRRPPRRVDRGASIQEALAALEGKLREKPGYSMP